MFEDEQKFILETAPGPINANDETYKEENVPTDPLEHFTIKEELESEMSIDEQSFSPNIVEGSKSIWLESSIKVLLSLVEEIYPKVGKSFKLHTKKKMWLEIQEKMAEAGLDFTVAQIESKFRGLERQYKKTKSKNQQPFPNMTCLYQPEIERIVNKKRRISPEFRLGQQISSSPKGEIIDEDVYEQAPKPSSSSAALNNSFVHSDEDSTIKTQKKKSTLPAKILKELQESRAERKEFHNKIFEYLQNKAEMDERNEERAERKEERDIRKLELLEKLVRLKEV